MKTIKTTQLTANKTFKALVLENITGIKEVYKRHIPQCGYVTFLKDSEGNTLGKYLREKTGMTLYIN